MAYRKLGLDEQERRAMLSNLSREAFMHGSIETTIDRAKEARKFIDKMITYAKKGTLVSRRKILAFFYNDKEATAKVYEYASKYQERNGGYTRILKLKERRGDNALVVILELV